MKQTVLAKGFAISQDYPIPLHPATQFTIDLPSQTYASLVNHNVTWQKVRALANETFPAGSGTVTWDSTSDRKKVESGGGIYFNRVVLGENVVARKTQLK